ncbi:hypothetical protein FACS1894191_3190 [Clostridia bacterium]|nr:hypothetical protein FACS1894191_3190 [Clostridia bacterium]
MNTVVNKLLEIDRQARQTLDDARQYYEKTLEETGRERERLLGKYAARAENHLADVTASETAIVEDAVARISAGRDGKISAVETNYLQNHTRWEQEIFDRCVKRVGR